MSSACTSKYGPLLDTCIVVSNDVLGNCSTGESDPGLALASTRHEATAVAPFQLA
jgi:hypothetical protein